MGINNYFQDYYKKGIILVLLTALVSGFSIFINSIGVREFDSSIFTFLKNSLVAAMLFAVILAAGNFSELKALKIKQWLQLALIGLIGGSIPFLLYFKGLQMATGAVSGFIHKTMFLYVAIFALVFLKEKITKGVFIGVSLLMLGNYLLLKPDFNLSSGHILIFIAVLFWAAEATFAKHVLKKMSGNIVAFGRMFFGSLFILVFLSASGKISLIEKLSLAHYMWVGLTSLFLLLYVVSFYNGLKYIKATTAACILSLGQPITIILAFMFSGKTLTLIQAAGMLLIIAGAISAAWLTGILSRIRNYKLLGAKEHGRN